MRGPAAMLALGLVGELVSTVVVVRHGVRFGVEGLERVKGGLVGHWGWLGTRFLSWPEKETGKARSDDRSAGRGEAVLRPRNRSTS